MSKHLLFKQYICRECGHKFSHAPIISNLIRWTLLVDPAPTYGSLLRSAVCPKCGSKNVAHESQTSSEALPNSDDEDDKLHRHCRQDIVEGAERTLNNDRIKKHTDNL